MQGNAGGNYPHYIIRRRLLNIRCLKQVRKWFITLRRKAQTPRVSLVVDCCALVVPQIHNKLKQESLSLRRQPRISEGHKLCAYQVLMRYRSPLLR